MSTHVAMALGLLAVGLGFVRIALVIKYRRIGKTRSRQILNVL